MISSTFNLIVDACDGGLRREQLALTPIFPLVLADQKTTTVIIKGEDIVAASADAVSAAAFATMMIAAAMVLDGCGLCDKIDVFDGSCSEKGANARGPGGV